MIRRLLITILLTSAIWSNLFAVNPLNSALDSLSTADDHGALLVGMDAATPADGDTLAIEAGWKVMIWSADAPAAALLKAYDSTRKLILYSSIDHGLKSVSAAIDTSGPGNVWSGLTDEYGHHRRICDSAGVSYNTLFYQFDQETKIVLSPRVSGGYTYIDTVTFPACTMPISDDDSSSIVPDSYSSPYFTTYGTLDTMAVDTVDLGVIKYIYRSFRYQGTPQGSKVTRVYLDFSNPLARLAEQQYVTRAFASNYANLGGTANNVYGWGALSAAGYHWDGVFLDNSSAESNMAPENMTLVSGGNIRSSRGVIGKWGADSTTNKMRSYTKEYFSQITTYCNSIGKITAANFGAWGSSTRGDNPQTQWFNDSNKINLKVFEFARLDGGYSTESTYETGAGATILGRTVAQLTQLDSLAKANDFYVMFAGRIDYKDTVQATGWPEMKNAFMRSVWARLKTAMGHRAIYAVNPLIATAVSAPPPPFVYQPCNASGVSYAGLNYSPNCNDRSEVMLFVDACTLPFMWSYDLGQKIDDSSATVAAADAQGQTVNVWKTFWRRVDGSDTTYSRMYYFPRVSSAWDWRHTGNHYVNVIPPSLDYKRLEYDGSLTDIAGAVQRCYIGDQLILSYTVTGTPASPGTKIVLQKVKTWPGADDALDPDPIP